MKVNVWESLEKRIRPKRLSEKQEQYWDILMFLLRLILLSLPLYVVMSFPGILYFAQIITANITVLYLEFLGLPVSQEIVQITIAYVQNPFTFIINEDCTGWKSVMFLFALIFAVKGPKTRSRIFGFLIGSGIILLANLARIIAVIYMERVYGADFAIFLHDWMFRYGLAALVLGLWAFWLVYLNKKFKK